MASSLSPEHSTASPHSDTAVTDTVSIVASVGRLLMDYALQLLDDVGPLHLDPAQEGTKVEDEAKGPARDDNKRALFDDDNEASTDTGETAALTEADLAECRGRLQRLQRIHLILVHSVGASTLSSRGGPSGSPVTSQGIRESEEEVLAEDYSETIRRNSVLTKMLNRLECMHQLFQGTSGATTSQSQCMAATLADTDTAANTNATVTVAQGPSQAVRTIEPLLTPVSLAEGALSAFSRNVGIYFRRRPIGGAAAGAPTAGQPNAPRSPASCKRTRAEDEGATESLNHWAKLAAQQRKSRFALYTLRSALLPRVNHVCAPFYVSPAVLEMAQLNAAAERFMLERVWCVHTKAHLLREVPSVAQDVELHRQALREALKHWPPAQQEDHIRDVSYARFVCTDNGVLRFCVQNALLVDVSYDLKRRQWTLLGLHWSLYTTDAGASLISATLADAVEMTATERLQRNFTAIGSASCAASESYQKLQPQNEGALAAFLQKALTEGGLSGGVHAANRLVCAVVLDALATQLLRLQQSFFTGGSVGRFLDVEVRPGTFISFHLTLPELFCVYDTAAPAMADVVHVKITTCGGTVMMERVRGTDVATRSVTLLLGTSCLVPSRSSSLNDSSRLVIDMEALLWQCLSAES
ncbi:hypothetical protein ABL78_4732 [Leptomonas seymouri]|uniref:Uncharacterized protein n=1 Tax=Leptomonas seymouri TaxID=5684 RepID=A0A0N0P5A1_LEPSE|nr:hypothetical protein ABL78_4732 [Leptomonas seymouri]|eukprot:KPI86219.1 hypothetical protein ABL78_4732 [Leptomonas seymouri]